MSILAFHGLAPPACPAPTALQVIQDWSCRMRTPDPHCFIDGLVAKLLADPPPLSLSSFAFTDKLVVRFSAILIFALKAAQAGRDTNLAAEAAFLQIQPLLCQPVVHTTMLAASSSPFPPTTHFSALSQTGLPRLQRLAR